MNFKMIFHVLGKMMILLAGLLILPTIVSLVYKEPSNVTNSFFVTIFDMFRSCNNITFFNKRCYRNVIFIKEKDM